MGFFPSVSTSKSVSLTFVIVRKWCFNSRSHTYMETLVVSSWNLRTIWGHFEGSKHWAQHVPCVIADTPTPFVRFRGAWKQKFVWSSLIRWRLYSKMVQNRPYSSHMLHVHFIWGWKFQLESWLFVQLGSWTATNLPSKLSGFYRVFMMPWTWRPPLRCRSLKLRKVVFWA